MKQLRIVAVIISFILSTNIANAGDVDENILIEGAKSCTKYLPRHERQYGIAEHLLAAIASMESGRPSARLNINIGAVPDN